MSEKFSSWKCVVSKIPLCNVQECEGGDINKGKSIQHTDLRYLEEKKNYDFQQSGDGIGKLKKLSVN